MTKLTIEEIKSKAKRSFADYTSHYDMKDSKIALKAKHTYKVAELCQQIAEAEGLSEEDTLIAWLCGMLHDIGRFEQVTQYGTFIDAQSIDHAHLSCQILYGTEAVKKDDICDKVDTSLPLVRQFYSDESFDHDIFTAVYWHSAYRYPESLTVREKTFCDILRDADKLDIFRVNLETPLSEIHNVPEEDFYTSKITPEVYLAFCEHHTVLRSLKRTPIDNVVGYLSLYWELVYPKSQQIAKEAGYLAQLAAFESKDEETRQIFSNMREALGVFYAKKEHVKNED